MLDNPRTAEPPLRSSDTDGRSDTGLSAGQEFASGTMGAASQSSTPQPSEAPSAYPGSATALGKQMFLPPLPSLRSDKWPGARSDRPAVEAPKLPPLPALPEPVEEKRRFGFLSFLFMVGLPTLCAAVYLFGFASPQYVSELRFSVMQSVYAPLAASTNGSGSSTLSSSATNAISMLTGMSGASGGGSVGPSSAENFIVVDYLKTRGAVDELRRRVNLQAMFDRSSIDPLSRFSPKGTPEALVRYWHKMIYADYDMVTGIATVRIKAFSGADALRLGRTLAAMSENVINQINDRAEADAVHLADAEVDRARSNLAAIRSRLNQFRNQNGTIDPTASTIPTNNDMARQLQEQVAGLKAQLSALEMQGMTASSPVATSLRAQIAASQAQGATVKSQVSRQGVGAAPLTSVMNDFENLTIEGNYAQAALITALQAQDQARANSKGTHFFITPYDPPSLPQSSTEPNRWLLLFICFAAASGFWLITLMIVRSVQDHEL